MTSPCIQSAVSLFIRLGFAHKKTTPTESQHPSWSKRSSHAVATSTATPLTLETGSSDNEQSAKVGHQSPSPSQGTSHYINITS